MDIDKLFQKLNSAAEQLKDDDTILSISKNIKENHLIDEDLKISAKREYYSQFSKYEKLFQIQNDEYKELVSQFSQSYLDICDFYVGAELHRETYLDSKKDVLELFTLFIIAAIWEPYINAFHKKFIQPEQPIL